MDGSTIQGGYRGCRQMGSDEHTVRQDECENAWFAIHQNFDRTARQANGSLRSGCRRDEWEMELRPSFCVFCCFLRDLRYNTFKIG